jgi:hypothetical protein
LAEAWWLRILVFVLTFAWVAFWINLLYGYLFEDRLKKSETLRGYLSELLQGLLKAIPFLLIGFIAYGLSLETEAFVVATAAKSLLRQAIGLLLIPIWILTLSLLAVGGIYVMRFGFRILEMVIRRCLEQEKGVLSAAAVVLGAVGLLLKNLS